MHLWIRESSLNTSRSGGDVMFDNIRTRKAEVETAAAVNRDRTLFQQAWIQFRRNKRAMFGLAIILLLFAVVIVTLAIDLFTGGSVYEDYVIKQNLYSKLDGPSLTHPLGCDEFGRDMLLGSTVSEINDNSDALVGAKPTKPMHVRFVQQDSIVVLQEFTARNTVIDPGYENVATAVKINKIPATIATFPIKAYAPDSSRVIDVSSLFLTDIKSLRPFEGGSSMGGLANRTVNFKLV